MDLNYKILIIDDEDGIIESFSEDLKEYMSEKGFRLEVDFARSKFEYHQKKFNLAEYNLFLIDLNFDNDSIGAYFIEQIRKECKVADILFYSSDVDAITDQRKKKEFEGIFFAQHDETEDVITKAKDLLNKSIKNCECGIGIRGIILQNMCLCDQIIKEKLDMFSLDYNGDWYSLKKDVLQYINESIIHHYKLFLKTINYKNDITTANKNDSSFCRCDVELAKIYSNYKITNSSTNFYILCKYLKLYGFEYINIKTLYDKLNEIRNLVAHKIFESNQNSIVLNSKTGDIILDEQKCSEIRRELIELIDALNAIGIKQTVKN